MASYADDKGFDPAAIFDHITFFRLSQSGIQSVIRSKTEWWSLLVELENISINQFEKNIADAEFSRFLIVPAAYDAEDREQVMKFQPVAMFATTDLVEFLNDERNRVGIGTVRVGGIVDVTFLDPRARPAPLAPIHVAEGTVVQAFVDDGMGIAHDLFRNGPTSSRVHFAQIFDAVPLPGASASMGRELEKADIDALLTDCTVNNVLDEDLFYTRSGQVNLARDIFSTVALRQSHGTHVMGLGAGHDMAAGADLNPIICAALPSRVVRDTSGVDLLPLVYLSFHILAKQARRFRLPDGSLAPVVFNFSYGNSEGPHDGSGIYALMFERYFSPAAQNRFPEKQKAWLTLPAGNANLSQLHALNARGETRKRTKLKMVVLPDDITPNHVQIWMPPSPENAQVNFAKVKVRPPFGNTEVAINAQPGQAVEITNDRGERIAWLAYRWVGGSTQRGLITLSINPTTSLEPASDLAPSGIWTIKIRRRNSAGDQPIHAWIDRDDTLPGHGPAGRQAFFENASYYRYGPYGAPLPVDPPGTDCPVRRSTTISGFACGPSPIVVAAYTEQEAVLSDYSAAGPLNPSPHIVPPPREGPDLAARGDDSWVQWGVYSAGSRSGTWVRAGGTSVAAPQVARLAAEDIAASTVSGRAWAAQAAIDHPFALEGPPSAERAGAGGIKLPGGNL